MKRGLLLGSILIASFMTATPAVADLRDRLQGYRVGSHQGGGQSDHPNTLAQFRKAVRDGADILEMDLHLSRDRVPVVFHDDELQRKTDCSGPVSSKTFAELQLCRLKKGRDPVTGFHEVLRWLRDEKLDHVVVNAEFKNEQVIPFALLTMQQFGMTEHAYFQTKNSPELYQAARTADPEAWLLFKPDTPEKLNWALSIGDPRLYVLELSPEMQTPENIARIHAAGKLASANAWPLRTRFGLGEALTSACHLVFEKGIDIAITDRTAGCVRQRPNRKAAD